MRKIIDKLPLLICCCVIFNNESISYIPVISLLAAISVSSLSQYAGKSTVSLISEIIYLMLCFRDYRFFAFFPVVFYDILCFEYYALCAVSGLVFALKSGEFEAWQTALLAGCTAVAAVLQKRTADLERIGRKLIETRDSSAELNMILAGSNKRLRENQDYEIHLATLKERNRIAREIHDNVGHLLSRSILQLGAVQLMNDEFMRQESLASLSDTLNNAMTEIRSSVHDLRDDSIDLKQTLSDAVEPLSENDITVRLEYDVSGNVPNNIKICVISIVKEGVSNIIKHSSADRVSVIMREHPAFYQLMIEDNGSCGTIENEDGMGLSNMRERVRVLGGIIDISASEKGFRIFVTLRRYEEQEK